MFERFDDQARHAIVAAREEARSLQHDHVGPEHLLLGLLRVGAGSSARALASAGLTLDAARRDVAALAGRGDRPPGAAIPFSPPAKQAVELSLREALRLNHRHIGIEHLLLGLISQDDSTAVEVLRRLGADPGQLRQRVIRALEAGPQDELAYGPPVPGSGLRPVMLRTSRATPARLDQAEARIAAIEERLTAIERRLNAFEDRLSAVERRPGSSPGNVVPPS